MASGTRPRDSREPEPRGDGVRPVYWGALAGVVIAYFPCGYLVGQLPDYALLAICLPVAAAVLGTWNGWVRHGELRLPVLLLAMATLLLNLLAAGGISFAGVSLSLWLLAALALNTAEFGREPTLVSRGAALALTVAALALAICCQQTEYDPVLRGSALLDRGNDEITQRRPDRAERTLVEAAAADRWSDQPWTGLAALRLQKWLTTQDDSDFRRFQYAAQKMLELNRRSSSAYRQNGDWRMACYLKTNETAHLREAIRAYGKAVELHPNDGSGRAQFAWCLHLAGQRQRRGPGSRSGFAARRAQPARGTEALYVPTVRIAARRDARGGERRTIDAPTAYR